MLSSRYYMPQIGHWHTIINSRINYITMNSIIPSILSMLTYSILLKLTTNIRTDKIVRISPLHREFNTEKSMSRKAEGDMES